MSDTSVREQVSINALFAGCGEDQARLIGGLLRGSTGQEFLIRHCIKLDRAPAEAARVDADIVFLDTTSAEGFGPEAVREVVEGLPGVPVAILDHRLDQWFVDGWEPEGESGDDDRFGGIPLFHAVRTAVAQKRAKIRLESLETALSERSDYSDIEQAFDVARPTGEEPYRILFDNAPVALWESDYSELASWLERVRESGVTDIRKYLNDNPDELSRVMGTIRHVAVNEAAVALFRAGSQEELKSRFPKPSTDVGLEVISNLLEAVWNGESRYEAEMRSSTLDGREIEVLAQWSLPTRDGHPDVTRAIIAGIDISARKNAEARSARLGRIVEDSINEIYVFDAHTLRFDLVTQGARINLGYSLAELREITPVHLKPDFTEESFAELLRPLRTGEADQLVFETIHQRKDGTVYPVEVHPQTMASASPPVFLAVMQDITDRLESEHALSSREHELRMITDNVPALISYVDADQRYRFVNKGYEAFFGVPAAEIVGKHLSEISGEEYYETTRPNIELALAGKSVSSENLYDRDGKSSWMLVNFVPDFSEDHEVRGFYVLVTDVTERKEAELSIDNHEKQLEILTDSVPVMIASLDTDRRYRFVNKAYEDAFGLDRDEIVGMHVWELIGKENYAVHKERIDGILHGEPQVSEGVIQVGSDARRWLLARYVPEFGASGQVEVFLAVVADITERKDAEERLRETLDRYQFLVDSSPAMTYIAKAGPGPDAGTAGDYVVSFMSDNIRTYLGHEPSGFVSDPEFWLRNIHPDDAARVLSDHSKLYANDFHSHEYRFRHKDGSYREMNDSLRLVRHADGSPAELVGYWIDVTERRMLERKVGEARNMESIGRLAGGIAHDFNNLLTAVIGYVDLMMERFDSDAAPELGRMKQAARRAADLTGQLLAFSGKQRQNPVVLDLNVVIEDNLALLERLIGEDVRLKTHLDRNLSRVEADRGQLGQILIRLVENARDAMPSGGVIEVETSNSDVNGVEAEAMSLDPGPYVRISVIDQGTGMDDQTRVRIFEPFFTTKDQGQGTGLGLSMVDGIVRQTGGAIAVATSPDHGTTVSVYLAVASKSTAALGSVNNEESDKNLGRSETILVVEDDEFVRDLSCEVLRLQGYRVMAAANGDEALKLARSVDFSFDLVLTDIVMPRMRGTELARRLLEVRTDIKILFMSAYPDVRSEDVMLN
jgi:PAS domain S-box-containing protein